ncbi:MAG: transposase [bacterium]
MSNLKKFNSENHIHFVTFKTFGRMEVKDGQKYYEGYPYFKDEKCCSILVEEFNFYREKLGFKIFGYVIMPNHVHMLIWWDIGEKPELTIGKIMRGIKGYSAKKIIAYCKQTGRCQQLLASTRRGDPNRLHYRNLQYKIWQKDSYDFNIFTLEKYQEKLNYIHNNPVRANLVKNPQDYKWSSYRSLYLKDYSVLKIDQIQI